MDPIHPFAFIAAQYQTQLGDAALALLANNLTAIQVIIILACTLYIAVHTIGHILGNSDEPVAWLWRMCLRAILVMALAGAAVWDGYLANFLMNAMPNDLMNAVAGGVAGNGGASFDAIFGAVIVSVDVIWKNVSVLSAKSIILGWAGFIELFAAGLFITIAFSVFLVTKMTLAIVVAFGPLFVAFLFFEQTVAYFKGWINSVIALTLTLAMITGSLVVITTIESQITRQVVQTNTGGALSDLGTQILLLVIGGLSLAVFAWVVWKLEHIAQSIAGAASGGVSAIGAVASSYFGAGARAAMGTASRSRAALSGGMSGGGAAGMRSLTPAGRAI